MCAGQARRRCYTQTHANNNNNAGLFLLGRVALSTGVVVVIVCSSGSGSGGLGGSFAVRGVVHRDEAATAQREAKARSEPVYYLWLLLSWW